MDPELKELSTPASTPSGAGEDGAALLGLGDLLLLDLLGHVLAGLGALLGDGLEHVPPGHPVHRGLHQVGAVAVPVVLNLLGGVLVGLGLGEGQRPAELHPQKGGDETGHDEDGVVLLQGGLPQLFHLSSLLFPHARRAARCPFPPRCKLPPVYHISRPRRNPPARGRAGRENPSGLRPPGRVPALGNKIPPQGRSGIFSRPDRQRCGKPSPKPPVSERSERIGVFPGPSGHGPGRRDPSCGP